MTTTPLFFLAIICVALVSLCAAEMQNTEQITVNSTWTYNPDTNEGAGRTTAVVRFFNSLMYTSLEVNTEKNGADLNYITGVATAPLIGSAIAHFPTATMAYFAAQVTVTPPSDSNPFVMDLNAAGGLMALGFWKLEERDPAGTLVKTVFLNRPHYELSEVGRNGPLHWATYSADLREGLFSPPVGEITITYLLSDETGMVDFDTLVSPSTLESVLQIANYQYADAANSLELSMGVASANSRWEANAVGFVTQDAGDSTVYFDIAKTVSTGSGTVAVTVSPFVVAAYEDVFGNNLQLKAQLDGRFSTNWEARSVKVGFPAGASMITYDPTLGVRTSSALTAGFSLLVTLFFTWLSLARA